ncbi:hypothetical protein HN592_03985 [Candidatus Woesearchaeota archaeon]|jgi:hypothetical protein|nr:hypothetical protein [Candidatus Woesearchaeota archaeon]MBT4368372.1 hypothetical protein [Candidatus Woesearchaeota archaeon]MBT4712861.1 hypothetical protein [Candidatus Woesearchaeota archaeon]MBT6639773.1 hypothetical protein [Candidatus Woesearchaeota archaeon]MBT7133945.1 hypothetical protein [Candidatus Woesearchaeota archaeon]
MTNQVYWQTVLRPYLNTALPNSTAKEWLLAASTAQEMQWERYQQVLSSFAMRVPLHEALDAFRNKVPASAFRDNLNRRRERLKTHSE